MGIREIIRSVDNIFFDGKIIEVYRKTHPNLYNSNYYQTGFEYPYRSYEALEKVLSGEYEFNTVLDVGCGEGIHSERFLKEGKKVTALDYGESACFRKNKQNTDIHTVIADINTWETDEQFDCVWVSHVLEHQINVNNFLKKIYSLTKMGGILAISVPPLKSEITGGHVTFWNPGLLLYNLILAGFDCSEAAVKTYEYDISVIVRKKEVMLPNLKYDSGDIRKLKKYFPSGIYFHKKLKNNMYVFDGNIKELNW